MVDLQSNGARDHSGGLGDARRHELAWRRPATSIARARCSWRSIRSPSTASEYKMHGTVTQALEGEVKGEVGKIGAGAAVGAIIGGILGGVKGAIAGILVGGGGVAAATPGSEAEWRRARCCACAWTNRRRSIDGCGLTKPVSSYDCTGAGAAR